jgi:uncharacterized protein
MGTSINRRQILKGFLGLTAAAAFGNAAARSADPDFIGIIGGGTGGAWHLGGATMGELAKEIWPKVSVTVRAGSSTVALRELRRRTMDFAWGWSYQSGEAFDGRGEFKGSPFESLRAVSAVFPGYAIGMGRPGVVESWGDLKGRRVNLGPAQGGGYQVGLLIAKYHGIEPEEMRISATDFSQIPTTFNDEVVDAAVVLGSIPHVVPSQIEASTRMIPLAIDEEIADKIVKENQGWAKLVFPEGTFNEQQGPLVTIGTTTVINTHADLDEEVVYKLTKAMWENRELMIRTHGIFSNLTEEMVTVGVSYPFHPGAERFWKEIGIL